MDKFDEWWGNSVFSCGLPQHKTTARSAFEAGYKDNQEILNLLKEIADNKEIFMTSGSEEQYDADEPRFSLKISGPERLIKKLADILWEME